MCITFFRRFMNVRIPSWLTNLLCTSYWSDCAKISKCARIKIHFFSVKLYHEATLKKRFVSWPAGGQTYGHSGGHTFFFFLFFLVRKSLKFCKNKKRSTPPLYISYFITPRFCYFHVKHCSSHTIITVWLVLVYRVCYQLIVADPQV